MTFASQSFRWLRQALRGLWRDERGNIAIMGALALPMVVGSFALGAEASYWYLEERKLQNAADVAAHAAAVARRNGEAQVRLEETARDIAGASGFDPAMGTLVLNTPPGSGAFAGDAESVEVLLTRSQPRYLSKIYAPEPVAIAVRAVTRISGGSSACLLALSPDAAGAVTLAGSTHVVLEGCDVASNSIASDSFSMGGGAAILNTGCVHTVGGAVANSNLELTECAAVNEGAPINRDPYADVVEPAASGSCQPNLVGRNNEATRLTPAETHALGMPSMRFCGGLTFGGSVTLDPGLYIVDGGELRVNSGTSLQGSGVTILLTGGAEARINGGAEVDLTAPATGPLAGIVIFGSRNDGAASHVINGNATSRMDGAIYVPRSHVDYSGNFGGNGGCVQVIVSRITFTGNSSLNIDCQAAGIKEARVNQTIRLVE